VKIKNDNIPWILSKAHLKRLGFFTVLLEMEVEELICLSLSKHESGDEARMLIWVGIPD
jgi:hypothetical protein